MATLYIYYLSLLYILYMGNSSDLLFVMPSVGKDSWSSEAAPFQACAGENPKGGERDDGPVPQVLKPKRLAPENSMVGKITLSFFHGHCSNFLGPPKPLWDQQLFGGSESVAPCSGTHRSYEVVITKDKAEAEEVSKARTEGSKR